MLRLFLICFATLTLSACISSGRATPLSVLQINTLSTPESGSAEFKGLEALANIRTDYTGQATKKRVNIFYVHGIGWTENPDGKALANNFITGIKSAYGLETFEQEIPSTCAFANSDSDAELSDRPDEEKHAQPLSHLNEHAHMFITADRETYVQSALPGSRLKIDRLVCMDKYTLSIKGDTPAGDIDYVIYRAFWDQLFWNALQFPHVGQDDNEGSSKALAHKRRKFNRRLKDEMVNYGFSDAVMYMGPGGAELRTAIEGAMCSAALDSSGYDFEDQGHDLTHSDACSLASYKNLRPHQFAFVTESLGSKIVFDVMQQAFTDDKVDIIDRMIEGSEFYMLANQVALLSLNDLSISPRSPVTRFTDENRPKIIAMSEVNDLLSYELIPFYEQLWKYSYRQREIMPNIYEASDDKIPPNSPQARQAMVDALGFEIIDMRLEFADRLIPWVDDLVDPLQAHGGHMLEPELVLYMLCGAKSARLDAQQCLANERQARHDKNKR